MNISQKKYQDRQVDWVITAFLDKYLYSNPEFLVEKVTDKERQTAGIDVILKSKDIGLALIDEKAATSYLDGNLPSFSLELLYDDSSYCTRLGWFMNKELSTTHYLFVWIRSKQLDKSKLKVEDIEWAEIMLVPKKALYKYMLSEGLYYSKLLKIAQGTKKGIYFPEVNKRKEKPYHISYSYKLAEHPVNLVVDKSVYRKLAVYHTEITV